MVALPWEFRLDDDQGDGLDLFAGWAAGYDAPTLAERIAAARPAWTSRALCRGLRPGLFFSADPDETVAARAVCGACPVVDECADYGSAETFGVWGGRDEEQRRADRRRTTRRVA